MIRLTKILMLLAMLLGCTLILTSCVGWVYALARWVAR